MYGKIGDGSLTGGANRAIVMASDVEVRCTQRQLATVKAANSRIDRFAVSLYSLSLPGALRRGVTVYTSSTPAGSLFVPAVEGREESRKSSIHGRSTCTAVSSRRNFNSSPDGSSSAVSTPEAGADAANPKIPRFPRSVSGAGRNRRAPRGDQQRDLLAQSAPSVVLWPDALKRPTMPEFRKGDAVNTKKITWRDVVWCLIIAAEFAVAFRTMVR